MRNGMDGYEPKRLRPYASYYRVDDLRARLRGARHEIEHRQQEVMAVSPRSRLAAAVQWLLPGRYYGWQRIVHLLLLTITLAGILLPVMQDTDVIGQYALAASTEDLLGPVNPNLAAKLSFNSQQNVYQFNAAGIKQDAAGGNPVAQLAAQAGGAGKQDASLYSVALPVDLSQGLTYYDNSLNISFKLVPTFQTLPGREEQGRVVYPLAGGGQLVYSFKANGLKEDILLGKAPADGSLRLSYHLQLPNTLAARLIEETGEVGIYSADPTLFGNISFGSTTDQQAVMKARLNSPKSNLVFVLPPPVIKQANGADDSADAHFVLHNNVLQVVAAHLDDLHYPLSIDPSVVVTSSADFATGNNEDSIAFPANQINRGGLTGGSVAGGWTAGPSFGSNLASFSAAAYNGYVYTIGGTGGSPSFDASAFTHVAPTPSNPVTWSQTTNNHTNRILIVTISWGAGGISASSVTYNGSALSHVTANVNCASSACVDEMWYMINPPVGTYTVSVTWTGSVEPIVAGSSTYYNVDTSNPFGTITTNTGHTAGFSNNATTVANQMVVDAVAGTGTNDLRAAGGQTELYWDDTSNNGGSSYKVAGGSSTTMAWTDSATDYWAQIIAPINPAPSTVATAAVQYAAINPSTGLLGSWAATTSLPSGRFDNAAVAYNGYLYTLGGTSNGTTCFNDVQYIAINSNGTLGASWATTTSFSTTRSGLNAVAYNGYIYVLGGQDASVYNDVQYAPVKADGTLGSWTSTTSFTTARYHFGAVAYNGYLYVMGGYNWSTSTYYNDVQYAPINSDGTVGTWTATTSFTNSRDGPGVTIYNGYLYVMGGAETYNDVQYAPINANGSVGSWTATANQSTYRTYGPALAYNGYIYSLGGQDNNGNYLSSTEYAKIDPAGYTTSFTTSGNAFTTTRVGLQEVTYNGRLYVLGGYNGTNAPVNTIYAATINSDGTIGTFTNTGMTSFTTARAWFAAVATEGYMYVIGGCSSANASCTTTTNDVATVYKAPINSDGTIGTWSNTNMNSLTTGIYGLAAVAYDNYMYVVGGVNGSTLRTAIYYHAIARDGTMSGAWTTASTTLATATAYMGVTAYGGNLYIAGGCTAGALTCTSTAATVYYASINPTTGALGTLTSTTSFTTSRGQFGLVALNGYLYVLGGWNGTTYYNDVQYAPIAASGAVGTWSTVTGSTLSTTRRGFATAAYAGRMYIAGGYNGTTYYTDVQYARVNNGGGGATGTWATTTSFTTGRTAAPGIAYNGYLYILGGTTSGAVSNTVQYSPISANGTIGAWTVATSFTTGRETFGAVAYNGYMYIFGGQDVTNTTVYNDVQYAAINANGSLSAPAGCSSFASGNSVWCLTTSMSSGDAEFGSAAYNGRLYIVGGCTSNPSSCGNYSSTVWYASFNANGTLGSWSTATNALPFGLLGTAVTAYNGYLYVLGGYQYNSGDVFFDLVTYAPLNSGTGDVGTWLQAPSFLTRRVYAQATIYNGYIYLIGGQAGWPTTPPQSEIQYAPVLANGNLGDWAIASTGLNTARSSPAVAAYNGYIYAYGGDNNSSTSFTTYNTVEYAPLNSIPRVGHYSKLISLGNQFYATSITYNGTLPGGSASISYRMAGTNASFGPTLTASSLAAATGPAMCPSAPSKGWYIWLLITLDDRQDASFPDVNGADANLTDVTVNYSSGHPTPDVRLRGGALFSSGAYQPLDTCGT